MAVRMEHSSSGSLITVRNLVVSHTVCTHVGGTPPTCVTTTNFVALGKTVWVQVGSQNFLGTLVRGIWYQFWDRGVADTLKHAPAPHLLPYKISSFYVKPFGCNYGNLPENFDPLHPAFQGHWRSLKLMQMNWLPITSFSDP